MQRSFIFSLLFLASKLSAQHENDIWFFGSGTAGMAFDHKNQTFKPYAGHKALGWEGCATITDPATGELLFYTDGATVYARDHSIMPNGTNLGGHSSSAQAVAVVPKPGSCDQYFVFSNSKGGSNLGELFYSIVDMNANGGLGAVITPQPIKLMTSVKEGMIAIPKPNSNEFWLLGCDHKVNSLVSGFYLWDITQAGPVDSQWFDLGLKDTYSYNLTYSKEAGKVALCDGAAPGKVYLFDFDASTGVLSNAHLINGNFNHAYDCIFSPDGSKLYYTNWLGQANTLYVHQYDMVSKTISTVAQSPSQQQIEGGGLQIGPDGKIYWNSSAFDTYISCIAKPNLLGTACDFRYHYIDLGAKVNSLKLPATLTPIWVPDGCNRPAWAAFVTSTDNYREPRESLCDVIQSGRAYLSPALSSHPNKYYWSNFQAELSQGIRISPVFSMECRVKNPKIGGGIDAYDITLYFGDKEKHTYAQIMGNPAALQFTGVGFGDLHENSIPALITNFEDWRILKLTMRPGVLEVYIDGVLKHSFPFKGSLCRLSQFGVSFKGSGECDWVKLYDNGVQIYQEDFNSPTELACVQAKVAEDYYINQYTTVQMLCGNSIWVNDGTIVKPGDNVMIIQMEGAVAEESETPSTGTILDYGKAGAYELAIVDKVDGNKVYVRHKLKNSYDVAGKVQLIFVPDVGDGILGCASCPPWNGETGGVLAFIGKNVSLDGDLDVSGKGFPGGELDNDIDIAFDFEPFNADAGSPGKFSAFKGRGIAGWLAAAARAKGNRANGGGGANAHNTGGGGGSNGGMGGNGGLYVSNTYTGGVGLGGCALRYGNAFNRVFMGGGGGAGHSNNGKGSRGGTGGGIILAVVENLNANGHALIANGEDAPIGQNAWLTINGDGGGGGGAGGSILLDISGKASADLLLSAKGGNGSSVEKRHGHGGGGGGGVAWVSQWTGGNAVLTGGSPGKGPDGSTNGATPGEKGLLLSDLRTVRGSELFEYLMLDANTAMPDCMGTASLDINAIGGQPPYRYSIDGGKTWQLKPVFDGLKAGAYPIVIQDACEATDSSLQNIITYPPVEASLASVLAQRCLRLGEIKINAYGGKAPLQYRHDSVWYSKPILQGLSGGNYQVIVRDGLGCTKVVDAQVPDLSEIVQVKTQSDTTITKGHAITLSGMATNTYPANYKIRWEPPYGLACDTCLSTLAAPIVTTTYILHVMDQYGCSGMAETTVTVAEPIVYVPNVFNPNANYPNNFFTVMSASGLRQVNYLQVFDRWGNMVFEAQDFQPRDDTKAWRGEGAPPAVYTWMLECEFIDGSETVIKGSVTLIK